MIPAYHDINAVRVQFPVKARKYQRDKDLQKNIKRINATSNVMPRVIFFELPADDPKRAIAFYEKVFGWTITKWEGPFDYWLITTGPDDEPGINGAIMPRRMPEQVTVDTMSVESVDDFTKRIVEAGGTVMIPKQAVPGQGYLAYCTDTEGNVFGVMQMDPSAK